LVAATLRNMDLLPQDFNCSNVTPKEFDPLIYKSSLHFRHFGKGDFPLIHGSFEEPFRIVFDPHKHDSELPKKVKTDFNFFKH